MLFTIEKKQIFDLPQNRRSDFKRWRSQITDSDYQTIKDELIKHISADDVHTSSWIPGSNWHGTVFEPLYYACSGNETYAAFFFGLILFEVMIEHPDCWCFGRFDFNGKSLHGLTYFKINQP